MLLDRLPHRTKGQAEILRFALEQSNEDPLQIDQGGPLCPLRKAVQMCCGCLGFSHLYRRAAHCLCGYRFRQASAQRYSGRTPNSEWVEVVAGLEQGEKVV